jgi:hypothetical protein
MVEGHNKNEFMKKMYIILFLFLCMVSCCKKGREKNQYLTPLIIPIVVIMCAILLR